MKNALIFSTLFLVLAATHAQAATKVCFGSTKSDDTKGQVLIADISEDKLIVKSIKGDTQEGTFDIKNYTIKGRDKVTYMVFDGGRADDCGTEILVNPALLGEGTTGLLQFRCRGEGFFSSVYVCKDEQ